MRFLRKALLPALLALLNIPALAQEPARDPKTIQEESTVTKSLNLINIATPDIPNLKKLVFTFDARPFGSNENLTYLFVEFQYGLTNNLGLIARGGGARNRYAFSNGRSLPHGGQEFELAVRYKLGTHKGFRFAVEGSVVLPNQIDNQSLYVGGQGIVEYALGSRTELFFTPKVLFTRDIMATLGGGIRHTFDSDWSVFGDIQGLIAGNNVYRLSDGSRVRQEVWGVGVRYAPSVLRGKADFSLGVTNGLGRTLGLSTQSGLSGSAAVYFNVGWRL